MGAGISGLSCAIELERHGIAPVIFEKRAHVGEALLYSIIWPRIVGRLVTDPLKYLRKEYNLELLPSACIKKMVMFSSEKKAVERGSLGYIFRRGFQNHSLESQLLHYVKTSINFDRYIELEDIGDKFDYVVVADANSISAKKLEVWTDTFTAHVRIATVLGKFDPSEVMMWMNTKYVKNGFCYLVPNSNKEASLVIIVNGITSYELDYYWKEFLFTENIEYEISATTDAEHNCGFVQPLQAGNVLFTGNAAGFTDDLIGCGGLNAIESGMLAGHAIAEGKDYNVLTKPIFEDIVKLHELRKAYNRLDNGQLNLMVGALDIPIIKNALYNNPFFKMSDMHKAARLFNSYSKKSSKNVR